MRVLTAISFASLSWSGIASAADLSDRMDVAFVEPPLASQSYIWTGAYIGAHAGYGWSSARFLDLDDCFLASAAFTDGAMGVGGNGGVFGAHAGYNWAAGALVVGVEGDIDWTGLKGSAVIPDAPGFDVGFNAQFHGTARLRAGVAFDRLLFYATGGLAFAQMNYSFKPQGASTGYMDSTVRLGWAVGGGAELAVSDRVSVRVEYLHSQFSGSVFEPSFIMGNRFHFDDHKIDVVKVGASYHL